MTFIKNVNQKVLTHYRGMLLNYSFHLCHGVDCGLAGLVWLKNHTQQQLNLPHKQGMNGKFFQEMWNILGFSLFLFPPLQYRKGIMVNAHISNPTYGETEVAALDYDTFRTSQHER
mgnify:CR=1 FL=1